MSKLLIVVVPVWLTATRCGALVQTTTATYVYNADGAPTAVTTEVDGQAAITTYLVWDNFVPSAADPTAGTVRAGNGNLIGVGSRPETAYQTQFQFDQRDRLVGAAAAGAQSVSYVYYPASLMAESTLASRDTLQFYHDISDLPGVSNILQTSTATWSSYLGDMTYLSDGSEQMRCQPRKDVAGLYEPADQSFTAQRYAPYGAPASGTAGGPAAGEPAYVMRDNPFQFSGEFKDPAWGGYYLRARWYMPEYQTFISRDPGDALHRYSYSGGNPIGRSDPSGLSYAQFSRGVNHFLHPLTSGTRGDLLAFVPVWGQLVGGAQLLGNLPEVWHHPNTRTWASFSFLVASIAVETGDAAPAIDRSVGPLAAFGGRIGADLGIGVGQTVLAGYRGHNKWDVGAMVQSISYNASGILWGRLAAGFGYRSHPLSADDVENMFYRHSQTGNDDEALVFKVRQSTGATRSAQFFGNDSMNSTLPALDVRRAGMFHEGLLAISKNTVWYTELAANDNNWVEARTFWDRGRALKDVSPTEFMDFAQGDEVESRFEFAGKFPQRQVNEGIATALPPARRPGYFYSMRAKGTGAVDYSAFSNNCQDHVARVLNAIQHP